jgi:hypothetical protein
MFHRNKQKNNQIVEPKSGSRIGARILFWTMLIILIAAIIDQLIKL